MTPEANISALCHEFTNALTEVLAENAVGLARRGRIARTHAAVKRQPGRIQTCPPVPWPKHRTDSNQQAGSG
jgi:hypothetical protein